MTVETHPHHAPVWGLALLLSLPFLSKAYHIDDANFLHLAEQARHSPLGLYHAAINWGGSDERAFDVLSNPPGVAWLLAALRAWGSEEEWLAHLGLLPFLGMTLEGMRRLALRFLPDASSWGPWPMLLWLVAPGLLLASQTVMPDLPLVGCYTLGLALALEGLTAQRLGLVLGGSVLAGTGALFRYSGLTVLPLLLLYGVLFRPPLRLLGLAVLAAALPSGVWAGASLVEYGRPHLVAMLGFQTAHADASFWLHKSLYQLSSLGLALTLPGVLLALGTGGAQRLRVGLGLGALVGLGVVIQTQPPLLSSLLLLLGMGSGAGVLWLALRGLRPGAGAGRWRRLLSGRGGVEAELCFLACWLLGVLAFNQSLRFAAVRYLLLGGVPALLLCLRACSRAEAERSVRRARWMSGGVGFGLSVALALSDHQLANGYRRLVEQLPPTTGTRYFVGHWGMQYYLERSGARALSETEPPQLRPGDQVFGAEQPWPQHPEGLPRMQERWRATLEPWPGLWTVALEGRGCFYAFLLAPGPTAAYLPFAWGEGVLDTAVLWEVKP